MITTILAINFSVYLDKRNEIHRAVMLYNLLFMQHPSKKDFNKYIEKHKLSHIDIKEMEKVQKYGEHFINDELLRNSLQSGDIEIFVFEKHYYYAYKMDAIFYYRSDELVTPYKTYIFITSFIVLLFLIILYRFIKNSISPLQDLSIQIQRFANGKKNINIEISGNDDVSQVAKAFINSVKKTQTLQDNRTLFLRNIMHELKTPITKGKLLIHFLEGKEEDKLLLENIFNKMQIHLDDLARAESLSEDNLRLNKKPYLMIDLFDYVIDMLDVQEKDISVDIEAKLIDVDFNLFSYAIKNLIDNALKYTNSKPIFISYKNDCFCVSNYGEEFSENAKKYFNAYERDLTQHSLEGMGLGLYITNSIIIRHNYKLKYHFNNGKHNFCIFF